MSKPLDWLRYEQFKAERNLVAAKEHEANRRLKDGYCLNETCPNASRVGDTLCGFHATERDYPEIEDFISSMN